MLGAPIKCDFGTQTVAHLADKGKDLNYEWSEWALRRRAVMLANLKNKRTHSTQTEASHFRRENETQVWRPKDAAVQMGTTTGQTMPKKLRYIAGLRGAPDVKMTVVSLELDIGQPGKAGP